VVYGGASQTAPRRPLQNGLMTPEKVDPLCHTTSLKAKKGLRSCMASPPPFYSTAREITFEQ
ncbi:hypothetical protein ACLOJK_036500, partial [Asimina triloba]